MYQFLAFLSGFILALVITLNGGLTQAMGAFPAAALIHAVGVVTALLIMRFQKNKPPLFGRAPFWMYTGGVVGVVTLLCNTLSFPYISITSLMALSLLGQALVSLAVDKWGLMGMEKRPFQKSSVIGLVFSALGVTLMLDNSIGRAAMAIALSLLAGVTTVISRSINARLSERIGALQGSFINHLAGLPVCLILMLFGGISPIRLPDILQAPWNLLGGTVGVAFVLLSNITVPRVSAFRLTVLTFIGQILASLLIDLALGKASLDASFFGGLIIALGMAINMGVDYAAQKRAGAVRR